MPLTNQLCGQVDFLQCRQPRPTPQPLAARWFQPDAIVQVSGVCCAYQILGPHVLAY